MPKDEKFTELLYCDYDEKMYEPKGPCTNAALARVEGHPTCGDHLRRRTIFAMPAIQYRKIQADMNERLLRAEAGA